MPIYEYTCRKCDARVEAMRKVTDKPLVRHAGCGGRLEKEWSRTGFQFKGSGWYVTDYAGRKTDAQEEKESAAKKETSEAASKSETPAESPAPAKEKSESAKSKGKVTKASKPSSKGAPSGGD